ncbi:prepilin-type N-terminal cleavage/methylation domain-containing protein, partial [Klebsiella grimontii]
MIKRGFSLLELVLVLG